MVFPLHLADVVGEGVGFACDRVDNYFLNIYSVSMIDIPMMTILAYIQNVFLQESGESEVVVWRSAMFVKSANCVLCLPLLRKSVSEISSFLDVYIMIMIAS